MKAKVTSHMLDALRLIGRRCGSTFGGNPTSNTHARSLTKLGWVQMRVVKVYGPGGTRKIINVRITRAGRAALTASRTAAAPGAQEHVS